MSLHNLCFQILEELIDTDSSTDDDDDQIIDLLLSNRDNDVHRCTDEYVQQIEQYTDDEFKCHFRMKWDTFKYILMHVRELIEENNSECGRPGLPAQTQLLIAIWCMCTPDSYRSVSARFGVSKSTAWYIVRRICNALYKIRAEVIKWPSFEEAQQTSNNIQRKFLFPNVIGAIDGTHINICAPKDNPESYVNRKGHHSIQLQVVCDDRLKFIHCYCGQVGSVHDQRVMRLSGINNLFNQNYFTENSHLLGDSAYQIHSHLLTPYRDNGHLTASQINYNTKLSSARMMVERSIGLLKNRWRSLLDKLYMYKTEFIPKYIIACCVLHNMCLLQNDEIEIPIYISDNNNVASADDIQYNEAVEIGLQKRIAITNMLL